MPLTGEFAHIKPETPLETQMKTLLISSGIACLLLPASFADDIPPPPAKVLRYAGVMIQRYDKNGDGILQPEEWEKMPGTPRAIDLDGDQHITRDELTWYFAHYGYSRTIHRTIVIDRSEPYRFDPNNMSVFHPAVPRAAAPPAPQTDTQESTDNTMEEMIKANESPIDDDIYRALLEEHRIPAARPYHVLPEHLRGVPRWFVMLDKNGDGQISLAEFAPALAYSAVVLFKRFDKNDNGFIEPNEVRRE